MNLINILYISFHECFNVVLYLRNNCIKNIKNLIHIHYRHVFSIYMIILVIKLFVI